MDNIIRIKKEDVIPEIWKGWMENTNCYANANVLICTIDISVLIEEIDNSLLVEDIDISHLPDIDEKQTNKSQ